MAISARVERIDPYRWRVPKQGGMRTHGLIFADEGLIKDLEGDQAVQQVVNVAHGFGVPADLEAIEANGTLEGADPGVVSDRAKERGKAQLGTVGSGNHFVEVGYVAETYDAAAAARLGLEPGRLTVFIHSGSRGLGYQVCDDSLEAMVRASGKYGITLPDRQLCCAPLGSPEARHYWGAMNAAANFAFANRQLMAHYARRALEQVFGREAAERTRLVYDVCHNIAKMERHEVGGESRRVCVHRKGATRDFPPGHAELAPQFRDLGQPVLIPGDMGRYSYVLLGTAGAYRETFGSTCHGAGRRLSRHQAKKLARSRNIPRELEARGVLVRAATRDTIDEEMPEAYKDVSRVVDVVHAAGIGRKVAQLKPVGVVKG